MRGGGPGAVVRLRWGWFDDVATTGIGIGPTVLDQFAGAAGNRPEFMTSGRSAKSMT